MSSRTQSALLFLACLAGMGQVPTIGASDNPKVKVEFRRAETEPAPGLTEATEVGTKQKIYLHKEADLTNEDLADVHSGKDSSGKPVIEVTFTKEGAKKMAKLCDGHMNKPMAILVDGKVLNAPRIRAQISDKAVISGDFTTEQVDKLVKGINGK
jgi:preprotein translocase subunit SecD